MTIRLIRFSLTCTVDPTYSRSPHFSSLLPSLHSTYSPPWVAIPAHYPLDTVSFNLERMARKQTRGYHIGFICHWFECSAVFCLHGANRLGYDSLLDLLSLWFVLLGIHIISSEKYLIPEPHIPTSPRPLPIRASPATTHPPPIRCISTAFLATSSSGL